MVLPKFTYHPDPIATGAVKVSDATCECCGRARGFAYAATVYATEDVESVCPWCIADGSLERRYDATLSDEHPLRSAGLHGDIIQEVTRRTPGYVSWQQIPGSHAATMPVSSTAMPPQQRSARWTSGAWPRFRRNQGSPLRICERSFPTTSQVAVPHSINSCAGTALESSTTAIAIDATIYSKTQWIHGVRKGEAGLEAEPGTELEDVVAGAGAGAGLVDRGTVIEIALYPPAPRTGFFTYRNQENRLNIFP